MEKPIRTTVLADKDACTGCGACVSICPKGAITLRPDAEGFAYPVVDAALCVRCDLCEKRCPAGQAQPTRAPHAVAAQLKDATQRRASSSGGVFMALARAVQARGGVVFGAVFDETLRVEHVGAFDEGELLPMRGSKYVQSDASEAIGHAAELLARGIPVLFSGTPCQVSGLYARLGGKRPEELLTVDFVCHGVPSPGVFAAYLQWLEQTHGQRVTAYTFRDKRLGWKNFSAVATFADGTEHAGTQTDEPFLYGFLQNLYLRPACHRCTLLRGEQHPADITLADLWGAQERCPERDDDTGLSLVLANTSKGKAALRACGDQLIAFSAGDWRTMARANPGLLNPPKAHEKRAAFFRAYAKHGFDGARVMKLLAGPSKAERVVRRVLHLPVGAARRLRALLGGKA